MKGNPEVKLGQQQVCLMGLPTWVFALVTASIQFFLLFLLLRHPIN
jgi:hypothetical protein